MKRVALVFSLVAIMIALARGDSRNNSPIGVVRRMIDAFESRDSHTWQQSFCERSLAEVLLVGAEGAVSFEMDETRVQENTLGDNHAEVRVGGVMRSNRGSGQDFDWRVRLEKKGGHWCVDSITGADFS
jgi:hypothetical protein